MPKAANDSGLWSMLCRLFAVPPHRLQTHAHENCPHCGKLTSARYRKCEHCKESLVPQSRWDRL